MVRVGIAYLARNRIMEKWQCPACGFAIEKPKGPSEPISDF